MPRWAASDIPWDSFQPQALDPDLLRIVKAAALTEYNAKDYARYLLNIFDGDTAFQQAVEHWREEEEQHGRVLGRYAEMADPAFSFERAFARFTEGYSIPVDALLSVRGSKTGELLARCIVETGTSSFYSAIAEGTAEPVLAAIAHHIAADEFRHYGMFRDAMRRHQDLENLSLARRSMVALGRINELGDDELAFAYHAANEPDQPYDRKRSSSEYATRAYGLYRRHHTERAVAMILKATGVQPQGFVGRQVARLAWWRVQSVAAA